MADMFSFRKARRKDEKLLFTWINDPLTRTMSIDSSLISDIDHSRWYSKVLKESQINIYIYEKRNNKGRDPVGNIRVEDRKGRNFLSWNISPEFRKQGLGERMLNDFVTTNKSDYYAKIKVENTPSLRICYSAGFRQYYCRGNITFWKNH